MLSNFYELNTGNAQITERMFTQMHEVDSAPLLFLNEKDAIIDTNLAMVSGYSIIWFEYQNFSMSSGIVQGKCLSIPIAVKVLNSFVNL